ncbi:MAG: DUF2283 domain-containing protein [Candidatus Aenigmarchaeota archaeon]|nr:DUF2283 domain-containing protein [Candidatus Aenigmarchaeota archaeon]
MRFRYDKEVDAGYIYIKYPIRSGEAKKTVTLSDNIILDFDKKDKLIGVEILNASKMMDRQVLRDAGKAA